MKKYEWVVIDPKDMTPQLRWTKKNGWVEKPRPKSPIFVLKPVGGK